MFNVHNLFTPGGRQASNQFIVSYGDKIGFKSYHSRVAIYDRATKTLRIDPETWDYSPTTIKYFKQFVNEYTPLFYHNKSQFLRDYPDIKWVNLN